jgi:hypothetical protein
MKTNSVKRTSVPSNFKIVLKAHIEDCLELQDKLVDHGGRELNKADKEILRAASMAQVTACLEEMRFSFLSGHVEAMESNASFLAKSVPCRTSG